MLALQGSSSLAQAPVPADAGQDDNVVIRPRPDSPPLMQGFPPPQDQRVTVDNFTESIPKMRWAMQNTPSVFKSVEVENSGERLLAMPREMQKPDIIDRLDVEFEGSSIEASEWLRQTETDALLVIHDGRIIVETYYGEMRPATRHLTWSLGKALLSLLVMQDREIDFAAPIEKYVPSLASTVFAGATVQHVMDQQTGLGFQETPPNSQQETIEEFTFGTSAFREATHEYARYERTTGILPLLEGESPADGLYDFLLRPMDKARPHGEVLWYAEPNIIALQLLLEQTAGKRILELLKTKLWRRVGAEHRINAIVDGLGTPAFGTGISMSARDIGRIGLLLLNRGRINGESIMPEDRIADILTTRNTDAIRNGSNLSDWQEHGPGYRNLFWTWPSIKGREPLLSALGLYGQHCVVDYNNQNVIVKLSSDPDITHLAEDVNAIRSLSQALK